MDNVTKATTSLTCNMVSKKNRHLPPKGDAHAPINDQVAGRHMSRTVRGSRTTNNVAHGANARMGAAAGCVCSGGPGQDQAQKCHKDQLSSGETRVDDGCVWTLIAGEPERLRPSAEAAELPLSRVAANSMKLSHRALRRWVGAFSPKGIQLRQETQIVPLGATACSACALAGVAHQVNIQLYSLGNRCGNPVGMQRRPSRHDRQLLGKVWRGPAHQLPAATFGPRRKHAKALFQDFVTGLSSVLQNTGHNVHSTARTSTDPIAKGGVQHHPELNEGGALASDLRAAAASADSPHLLASCGAWARTGDCTSQAAKQKHCKFTQPDALIPG